jgi:dynein heavy chain, axonemal
LVAGVELPQADYRSLDAALVANCTTANLQAVPVFIEKAHQLYEMILVRHGLMIVGLSYGAKTAIYKYAS